MLESKKKTSPLIPTGLGNTIGITGIIGTTITASFIRKT